MWGFAGDGPLRGRDLGPYGSSGAGLLARVPLWPHWGSSAALARVWFSGSCLPLVHSILLLVLPAVALGLPSVGCSELPPLCSRHGPQGRSLGCWGSSHASLPRSSGRMSEAGSGSDAGNASNLRPGLSGPRGLIGRRTATPITPGRLPSIRSRDLTLGGVKKASVPCSGQKTALLAFLNHANGTRESMDQTATGPDFVPAALAHGLPVGRLWCIMQVACSIPSGHERRREPCTRGFAVEADVYNAVPVAGTLVK